VGRTEREGEDRARGASHTWETNMRRECIEEKVSPLRYTLKGFQRKNPNDEARATTCTSSHGEEEKNPSGRVSSEKGLFLLSKETKMRSVSGPFEEWRCKGLRRNRSRHIVAPFQLGSS
jgi:hypothetical protein